MNRKGHSKERGAALVEMALVSPLLLLLLLGIIEFGWMFGQYNAVRHATREGARVAAVDASATGDECAILDAVESSLEGLNSTLSNLQVVLTGGGQTKGTEGTISVTVDTSSLSGAPLITSFLPTSLSSTAEFRLERDAGWSNTLSCP